MEIGKIDPDDVVTAREAVELRGDFLRCIDAATPHHDVATLLDELAGGLEPDTRVRTGHDVHVAGQVLGKGRFINPLHIPRHLVLLEFSAFSRERIEDSRPCHGHIAPGERRMTPTQGHATPRDVPMRLGVIAGDELGLSVVDKSVNRSVYARYVCRFANP